MNQRYPTSGLAAERGVFANRTLNLRSVRAVGYDMDYTLIHYNIDQWEGEAFEHARKRLVEGGLPAQSMSFDPDRFIQGLVIDLELGNLIKATRFGYVIQATHGTEELPFDRLRGAYQGVVVDLADSRFRFLNTLFSLSEASLYAQLVDALDAGEIPDGFGPIGYDELYRLVAAAVDESHAMGRLKAEIISDPDRFCEPDPQIASTLLDQRLAGKKLLLITNSGWDYTNPMMSYAFDDAVPNGTWRDLFDIVVCAANKPRFFEAADAPWRLVDADAGYFVPHFGGYVVGEVYSGGNAGLVESSLGLAGDEILYVGDHLFGDVHVSKRALRWRTALIIHEIEAEIADAAAFQRDERRLRDLMSQKMSFEAQLSELRLERERLRANGAEMVAVSSDFDRLYEALRQLDEAIAPLAIRSGELGNLAWGPLMRAGNDKSLFARQVERYADIYTSRVSNLMQHTPYAYYRAARTTLPHDSRAG